MKRYLLPLILLIALALRAWDAGSLPAALNRDEAALAYNATLLLESGKDEWERTWPLTLESFGDFKLPGYVWHLIPLFSVFGQHDWVARLPSVLAGGALVLIAHAFGRHFGLGKRGSLVASIAIATAPVFLFYSRMAFEANLALAYFLGGLALLLGLQKSFSWGQWAGMSACFLMAVCTYNTPLLLLPALMVFIALAFPVKKNRAFFWKTQATLLVVFLIGAFAFLPATSQKTGITLFTDETVRTQWVEFRQSLPAVWQPIAGSQYAYYALRIAQNFVQSFSPEFLVTRGGSHPWHSLPGTGHLLWAIYGLGMVGIVSTLSAVWHQRKHWEKLRAPLAWLWLLIASLAPAVITVDAPHATRSLLFLFLFHLFAVRGLETIAQMFRNKRLQNGVWAAFFILLFVQSSFYLWRLFNVYPTQQAIFQPGLSEMLARVEREYPDREVAVVDPAGYQYILVAWYLKLPAESYFSTSVRQLPDTIGFRYGERVTHYHFIAQPADRSENETILVQWSDQEKSWQIKEIP